MVADLRVVGADTFRREAMRLRASGKQGRVEFRKALNRSTRPLKDDMKRSAGATLPRRGGLAKRVQAARFTTKATLSAASTSVRIEVRAGGKSVDVAAVDAGRLRHPTYGHRPWVAQAVTPGWASDPFNEAAPKVFRELLVSVDALVRDL